MPEQKKSSLRLFYEKFEVHARKITLPGFDKVPLVEVGGFFLRGILKGSITTRSSSIAFNLFLAIFPTIIFVFTLLPHIPIDNFHQSMLDLLRGIMPQSTFGAIEGTITDIMTQPRGGLLSVGFFAAFYFSTNGINAMIASFNATYHALETRSWWNMRLMSLLIIIILFVLITAAVVIITLGGRVLDYMVTIDILQKDITLVLLNIAKWLVILALFFFAISILYFLAPAGRSKFRFISAGASLATVMIIASSLGFSYYVNSMGQYNKIYGSIGTLIVILLWLYFNSMSILIGFELNASISNATKNDKSLRS